VIDLLMLMAILCNMMLNKSPDPWEIEVFDMSTVILHSTFKAKTPFVDLKLLSMKRCDSFCHSVIIALFSSTMLTFRPW